MILILTEKYFPASGNHFRCFFQKKQFFSIVETYFLTNISFQVVETDFLASTNDKFFISSSGNVFLTFIPAIGKGFSL